MTISCYTNTESPETFPKTPTAISGFSSVSIDPLSYIDVLKPTFVVSYDSALLDCNYVYCDTLNRFYFAKASVDTSGKILLQCTVDFLNSHSTDILNCNVTVIRNSDIIPTFYPDKQLPIIPTQKEITSIIISNDLFSENPSNNYALITIG